MTRPEAIQSIVWALLAHSGTPNKAVAMASTQLDELGPRAKLDFRNLLRSAGSFAFDDDGFFIRYADDNGGTPTTRAVPSVPMATHVLTVPIPTEPRMRIAYSVFSGLLLKYLYQQYGLIPLEVGEGIATLWSAIGPVRTKPALPDSDATIWKAFQASELASYAFHDGLAATFAALQGVT